MPDLDELLSARVGRPLDLVPPPLAELQGRAARRQRLRWAGVAVGAAAALALGLVAPSLPWPAEREETRFASELSDRVLDSGEARNEGLWQLVVTQDDGWCITRITKTGQGGACQLSTPGRLREASQFPTWDGEEYVVVLAGPAPPGTHRIEVTAQGVTPVVTLREIDGRLFWTARVPPGYGGTRAVAYDVDGAVIEELDWAGEPPPDGPPAPPVAPPPCPPGQAPGAAGTGCGPG